MTVNLMDAAQFPLQDNAWRNKLAITVVLLFIPIFGWFVIGGYAVRLVRDVLNGSTRLPEYDDLAGDFMRGLFAFVGGLIYNAPMIVLSCCTSFGGNEARAGAGTIQFIYGLVIAPFVMSALARYAITDDFGVYLDFGGRFEDVMSHTNEAVALWINVFLLQVAMIILIPIGIVLCCIPGLIAIAANAVIYAHLTAQWGKIIGVGGPTMMMSN